MERFSHRQGKRQVHHTVKKAKGEFLEWAETEIAFQRPASEDGRTVREHLTALAIANKREPKELADHSNRPPHFPHLWRWFCEFRSPITWDEIRGWSEMSKIQPSRFEGIILIQMDVLRNG